MIKDFSTTGDPEKKVEVDVADLIMLVNAADLALGYAFIHVFGQHEGADGPTAVHAAKELTRRIRCITGLIAGPGKTEREGLQALVNGCMRIFDDARIASLMAVHTIDPETMEPKKEYTGEHHSN